MPLAILGAMPEEISALTALIPSPRITSRAGRDFVQGTLGTTPVVVAFSRWGKVAAASTAAELVLDHRADRIVFCGVAGGLIPALRIGDVVVADHLFQHDLDASPFYAPTQIPLLGVSALPTDPAMSAAMLAAAAEFLRLDLPRIATDPARIDLTDRRWQCRRG
jgi:adenosylhomocysteine nucleosidase